MTIWLVNFIDWDTQRVVAAYDSEKLAQEHAARDTNTLEVESIEVLHELKDV